jgi:hypothetical protein
VEAPGWVWAVHQAQSEAAPLVPAAAVEREWVLADYPDHLVVAQPA